MGEDYGLASAREAGSFTGSHLRARVYDFAVCSSAAFCGGRSFSEPLLHTPVEPVEGEALASLCSSTLASPCISTYLRQQARARDLILLM